MEANFTVLKEVSVTLLEIFGAPRSHSALPIVIGRPGNCSPLGPSRHALHGVVVL